MIEFLNSLGLSKQESKIYIALLRYGSATASKISEETQIDRATTYRYLSLLTSKGMVSSAIRNNVKYFNGSNPNKIKDDLKLKLEEAEKIIPKLEELNKIPRAETKAELYQGKEGLKTIMKDILREGKNYTFIGEVEKFFTEIPDYTLQWLSKIERAGIKGKLICNEKSNFKTAKTESYRLVQRSFISKISTWTYGNKTAIFIWSNPIFGLLIKDQEVAESNRSTFKFLWSIAKKSPKRDVAKTRIFTKTFKTL